jgi:hypothetical protein
VKGLGLYAYDGRVAFDQIGKSRESVEPTPVASQISWSASTYSIDESVGVVELTLLRSAGTAGEVQVDYSTADGSAVAGADYTAASGTVTFADGDAAPKTVQIAVIDDTLYEAEETFTVSLTAISGGTLATPATAAISVVDDDPLPAYSISGQVTADGVGLADVAMTSAEGAVCTTTDIGGYYSCEVDQGWTGSIVPVAAGYGFDPTELAYADVQSNADGQDFAAVALQSEDSVWIEDADPASMRIVSEYGWGWSGSGPVAPYSGAAALYSPVVSGQHRHAAVNASAADSLVLEAGDRIYVYVWLDPEHLPRSLLLGFQDSDGVDVNEHRAYWGENLLLPGYGVDGTASRLPMGALPAAGGWVRLEVAAADLDLASATVKGLGLYAYDGRVAFDQIGKSSAP